ncbi:MAG: efflux RND transporter periplasmic adaptor subunit [Rhodopirellula sp.]|nr:efflux RND transporter periplasmic adaptor subunit [Rhodopirellula sp.]
MILVSCLPGCGPQKAAPAPKTAPAKIEHPNEGDAYRLVLTPKAEERLQISTVPVELKAMPRTRLFGGEVTVPDGASVFVTAPVTGTLQPAGGAMPVAGQSVTAGQTLFQLLPLLSPEREVPTAAERVAMASATATLISSQITADGDVKQAEAQVEASQIALDRAKRLLADKAGSGRDVDDAQARLDIAIQGLKAASARKQMFDKLTLEAKGGTVTNIPVLAPHAGILRMVSSSVGQTVSLAAPLFEVVTLNTLWVRVPIYPGQRDDIARQSNALVRNLGGDSTGVSVKPVSAPPSADPLATTIDLFYELPNSDSRFRPRERVEVVLPLTGETESLVVPRAAILRDIHGVAWVYVNSAEHTFKRHRVEVHFTTKESAILSRGPEVGTRVVVDGAAELFGTEFGAGK